MTKSKVLKNIRYFLPIVFKLSPFTVLSMVLSALLGAFNQFIWIIFPKLIIDELMNPASTSIKKLVIIVVSFVLVRFVVQMLLYIIDDIANYYARKSSLHIDKMLNDKVMKVDYFHVEDPEFIDLMTRAKKGMDEYTNGIYSFLYAVKGILESIFTILGVIGIIFFSKEYVLILISMIGVILNTITFGKIQKLDKKFNDAFVRHHRKTYYYNKTITAFRLQKDLRLYHSKKMIQDVCKNHNTTSLGEYKMHSNKIAKIHFLDTVLMYYITRIFTIGVLAYSVFYRQSTIAVFTMLLTAINTLDNSAANFIFSTKQYIQDCQYQNDFIDLMKMETVFKEGTYPIEQIDSVEFRNVSFKYPRTDHYILKNVSFKISNKEKVSLVGLNGSGKTTMIKLLCRFFKVEEGEILVNGMNINYYDYSAYMKLMAIVFQDFKIISFSVKSNVAILEEDQEKLYDALRRAQVLDKVLSLPNKENTYVNKWFDKTGVEFSGGEMQKFAMARCLYKDSCFIILDEPTSSLDPLAEAEIYYNFNKIVGKKLTLFISHRLSSCIFSDRILVLDGASIVEEGKHQELMKNKNGLYANMFTSQAEYYK